MWESCKLSLYRFFWPAWGLAFWEAFIRHSCDVASPAELSLLKHGECAGHASLTVYGRISFVHMVAMSVISLLYMDVIQNTGPQALWYFNWDRHIFGCFLSSKVFQQKCGLHEVKSLTEVLEHDIDGKSVSFHPTILSSLPWNVPNVWVYFSKFLPY